MAIQGVMLSNKARQIAFEVENNGDTGNAPVGHEFSTSNTILSVRLFLQARTQLPKITNPVTLKVKIVVKSSAFPICIYKIDRQAND